MIKFFTIYLQFILEIPYDSQPWSPFLPLFLWQRKPPFPDPLKLCAPQMTFNCIRGSCDMGLWRGGIFGGGSAGAVLSLPPAHI